ncbi:hypothetical protein PILCRDRAFT_500413 [Piloderma croceum F 1598]|uniref:Uncharacterized protein n=1 Tax=Piloderma croceum (strain F 1598) TaxID=765440 RepID=A0A0C3BVJ7_PILCF|nr:hypothetical protein PILCRDRAFT_500413 [Piloderma croceum F 1598]
MTTIGWFPRNQLTGESLISDFFRVVGCFPSPISSTANVILNPRQCICSSRRTLLRMRRPWLEGVILWANLLSSCFASCTYVFAFGLSAVPYTAMAVKFTSVLRYTGRLLTVPYNMISRRQRYSTGGLTAVKRSIRHIRMFITHTIR